MIPEWMHREIVNVTGTEFYIVERADLLQHVQNHIQQLESYQQIPRSAIDDLKTAAALVDWLVDVSESEKQMQPDDNNEQLVSNVLVHLYHSAVIGVLRSIRLVLGMNLPNEAMNPRHKDLKAVYDALGSEQRRLFYDAVAAISEFAVYRALDFIEHYNRFESEENRNEYPRLSLVYSRVVGEDVVQQLISQFGSDELGKMFKHVARDDEMRLLVDETIKSIIDRQSRKNSTEGERGLKP